MSALVTGSSASRIDAGQGGNCLIGSFQAGAAMTPGMPVRLVSGTNVVSPCISTACSVATVPDYIGFNVVNCAAGDAIGIFGQGTRIDNFSVDGLLYAGQLLWISATAGDLSDTKIAAGDPGAVAQALNAYDIVSVR